MKSLYYKDFHTKNKCFEFEIVDNGWSFFEVKFKKESRKDHATTLFKAEIFGICFSIYIVDKRHYNDVENRFYFNDEPEHYFFKSRTKFIKEVKKFMKNNPKIDAGYYVRALKTWDEWKVKLEEDEIIDFLDYTKYNKEVKKLIKTIPWETLDKGITYDGDIFKMKYENNMVKIIGFRTSMELEPIDAICIYDLYDKKGNLLSKRFDYAY